MPNPTDLDVGIGFYDRVLGQHLSIIDALQDALENFVLDFSAIRRSDKEGGESLFAAAQYLQNIGMHTGSRDLRNQYPASAISP